MRRFIILMLIPIIYSQNSFCDSSSELINSFKKFNNCNNLNCSKKYMHGFILKQLNSVKKEKQNAALNSIKLSSYKPEVKINGNWGAIFVNGHKYLDRNKAKFKKQFICLNE